MVASGGAKGTPTTIAEITLSMNSISKAVKVTNSVIDVIILSINVSEFFHMGEDFCQCLVNMSSENFDCTDCKIKGN